jgi:NADPH:quinone reductase-like Zn-dependent oxidoreductase
MQQYTLQSATTVAKVRSISCQVASSSHFSSDTSFNVLRGSRILTADSFVAAYLIAFTRLSLSVIDSFPAVVPPNDATTPILMYGGGSTVGQYTIQVLRAAGYKSVLVNTSPSIASS